MQVNVFIYRKNKKRTVRRFDGDVDNILLTIILFGCTNEKVQDGARDRVVSLRPKKVDKDIDIPHDQRYESRRYKERERISLNLSILACDIGIGSGVKRNDQGSAF